MRIVAGTARGRRLMTPEGTDVRPTKDRVREAVFNSLHSHGEVEDRTVLDLFAGSGAMGLEALSRGASRCTFVDRDRRAIAAIHHNLDALGFADRATVRHADSPGVLASLGPHDVALLDPPYDFDDWASLLDALPARVVVIESDREIVPGEGWEVLKAGRYAGTVVCIARRAPGGPPSHEEGGIP